ncbi:hypothetical protein Cadr_000016100 [Camelus dromedarius]|uniref:Uncharacterized protein n=1 Tax=Camelus dromedarius TaxID=9838 RepID=A0A5N4EA26_CAMDR|nr:hypothetical protein Cadr_000016100 [Camelus dromedarius]
MLGAGDTVLNKSDMALAYGLAEATEMKEIMTQVQCPIKEVKILQKSVIGSANFIWKKNHNISGKKIDKADDVHQSALKTKKKWD